MRQSYDRQSYVSAYRRQLINKFVRENSPCNGCPDRRQRCHAVCEAGKKFDAALENFKSGMLPKLTADACCDDYRAQRGFVMDNTRRRTGGKN